ncbi:hypothetical protein OIU78_002282 [Salix suchowensis]|nr:hypothetical protein OIU78_002282 [Salix suchowensis]
MLFQIRCRSSPRFLSYQTDPHFTLFTRVMDTSKPAIFVNGCTFANACSKEGQDLKNQYRQRYGPTLGKCLIHIPTTSCVSLQMGNISTYSSELKEFSLRHGFDRPTFVILEHFLVS